MFFLILNFYLLRPRKAKEFIPEVANKLSLSEEVIEDVINFYWREIRKNLSELNHVRVHLTNLGDFTLKYWKVDKRISYYEDLEKTNKQKGLQQITARFKLAETIYNLKEVKKILDEEQQRKDFIKLHKNKNNESGS